MTKTEFNLWNTSDWTKQRVMPRTPMYAIPLSLNPKTDSFVVTSAGAFQLIRLGTGELLPNTPAELLPKFNASGGALASGDFDQILESGSSPSWLENALSAEVTHLVPDSSHPGSPIVASGKYPGDQSRRNQSRHSSTLVC